MNLMLFALSFTLWNLCQTIRYERHANFSISSTLLSFVLVILFCCMYDMNMNSIAYWLHCIMKSQLLDILIF